MLTGNTEKLSGFRDRSHSVCIGLESNIGERDSQQDAAIVSTNDRDPGAEKKLTIAVLCDGMGGMRGGELASNLCANRIYEDFNKKKVNDYDQFLKEEIEIVDRLVAGLKDGNEKPMRAGTTMVAVIIEDDSLYWASVGDSRLYVVRGTDITQVTTDHNYYMELLEKVKRKKISLEEAEKDKDKGALTSFIGMNGVTKIDRNKKPFKLLSGDCLILCSDGLYRSVDNRMMKNIVLQHGNNMARAAIDLVGEALSKRKKRQDNTTAITIKYL